MDKKALLRRRRRLERQRDAELRRGLAKWQRRINSVDRLLRADAAAEDITSPTKSGRAFAVAASANAVEGKVNGDRKKGVMEVLRQTLECNRGFFTAKMLVEFINKAKSIFLTGRDISHSLRSLRELGEIRLVEKGKGRKPHMYLKL